MTDRAIGREAARNVRGVRSSVELRLVASEAVGGRRIVVVVGVALRAGHGCMLAGQRIVRIDGMIEFCIRPIGCRVADSAVPRQAHLGVRRVVAVDEVIGVARIALRRCSLKDIIAVAGGAFKRRVCARQGISRIFQVVKLGIEPTVHRVAALAGCRQAKSYVIENRCQKILLMARIACRRQAHELSRSGILVAIFALYEYMCSNQWESILVILNRLQRNLPSLNRMAVGAVGPELTAVNVRVTVRTLRTYVLENQAGMALCTAHVLMHTAKRVSGLIMIEFRIRPDRFPTCVRMTICAWDGKRSVGIRHLGLGNAYTRLYTRAPAGVTGRFAARIRGSAA